MNRVMYCGNCGNKGHIYKQCHLPITSLGIICVKYPESINELLSKDHHIEHGKTDLRSVIRDQLKFLIICRRNSIGYFEFLRGKYSFDNIEYLVGLFDLMTEEEKRLIKDNDFKVLWNGLWNYQDRKQNHTEVKQAEFKFNSLKTGYFHKKRRDVTCLVDILERSKTKWTEPEWGFPKGRRHPRETDIVCAKREFTEESGLGEKDITMLELDSVEEIFKGTNDVHYLHRYFLAQDISEKELRIDTENLCQLNEISQIKWVTIDEACKLIRGYSIEKIDVIKRVYNMLEGVILSVH